MNAGSIPARTSNPSCSALAVQRVLGAAAGPETAFGAALLGDLRQGQPRIFRCIWLLIRQFAPSSKRRERPVAAVERILYTREEAAYPKPTLHGDKYWAPVGRVDNVWGDRNLSCSCPPIASYED